MFCLRKHAGHLLVNTVTRLPKYLNVSTELNTHLRNYQTTQIDIQILEHQGTKYVKLTA